MDYSCLHIFKDSVTPGSFVLEPSIMCDRFEVSVSSKTWCHMNLVIDSCVSCSCCVQATSFPGSWWSIPPMWEQLSLFKLLHVCAVICRLLLSCPCHSIAHLRSGLLCVLHWQLSWSRCRKEGIWILSVNLELDSIRCTWLLIMWRLCPSTMMINSKSVDSTTFGSFIGWL